MTESPLPRIAISIGDPAGIGAEIALKAMNDPGVSKLCRAVLVGHAGLIDRCDTKFGINCALRVVHRPSDFWLDGDALEVLHIPGLDLDKFQFGVVDAANGRALLAYAERAIRLAEAGIVDSVVAAPQNQSAVKAAGIAFDGYSTFLARTTGTAEDDIFLMVASERFRITHVTLHLPMRDAVAQVRRDRVLRAIKATDAALRRMGISAPRIGVSGLNPHAGEGGLWGREEIDEIAPAIADAKAAGIAADGPLGADVMLARGGRDAYVVMIHDQGHIPAKLERDSAALSIGAPMLFASVAHGSAHDIAGKGVADPTPLINAIRWTVGGFTGA
jgi:4-hydroxy-L-threonine phosphate dehydrogenase PdxA